MTRLDQLRALQQRIEREIAREIKARQQRTPRPEARTRRRQLEHGTDSGYYWHLRHKVPFPEDTGADPCGCRAAHADQEAIRAREARRRRRVAA